jgi:glycosyltransferase involved in cell wall biosynthesis
MIPFLYPNPLNKPSVFFLYTELGGYTVACMRQLVLAGIDVHVVHYQINKEAPFQFDPEKGLFFYLNTQFTPNQLLALVKDTNPSLIICSGWIDRTYIRVCMELRQSAKLVIAIDNQWRASLKQYLWMTLARLSFLKYFDFVWVPGARQADYALRLGFKKEQIYEGFYVCDTVLYNSFYEFSKPLKKEVLPKRFVYVGRYLPFKGIGDLWQAFIELKKEEPSDWELWCVGTGDMVPIIHPQIRHMGFLQPGQMGQVINETSVFIIPSRIEPWGVVVQEFAAAGFPLLCSKSVGAADTFLEETINGFTFASEDIESMKEAMRKVIRCDDDVLRGMGEKSHLKASVISPDSWIDTIYQLMKNE